MRPGIFLVTDDELDSIIDAVTVRAFDRLKFLEKQLDSSLNLDDYMRDLFVMGVHLGITAFIDMYFNVNNTP